MIIELELTGNLTTIKVDVHGYFTKYRDATWWEPSEGGDFIIDAIERNGKDVTKRLDKCKGLLDQISTHIEENYND